MDANQTRFILLLGKRDWGACVRGDTSLGDIWDVTDDADPNGLAWNSKRDELTLSSDTLIFAAPGGVALRPEDRRGAGCDAFGNWYWIDQAKTAIMAKSSGTSQIAPFWRAGDGVACGPPLLSSDFQPVGTGPPPPCVLRGLAVTSEHYLVVGVLDPAGLLIFDLHAGGPPRQVLWPVPFAPFDMAPAPGGGVWVLERPVGGRAARFWALDRRFEVIRLGQAQATLAAARVADFQPSDGSEVSIPAEAFPTGIALDASVALPLIDPIAIEALPDGSVLLLDNGGDNQPNGPFAQVWHFRLGQPLGLPASTRGIVQRVEPTARAGFSLVGHDFAFLSDPQPGEHILGQLLIVGPGGNQAFAFTLRDQDGQIALTAQSDYLPLRLFGGKGIVACGTNALYDTRGNWLPLVRQPRARYIESATLTTPQSAGVAEKGRRGAFDSGLPDCVWHRLLIDGCVPEGCEVTVYSRAAETLAELLLQRWIAEPRLYRRGEAELPFSRGAALDDEATWELLLQGPNGQGVRGRYLQLQLTLHGGRRSTPRLRALRVYYPRFSYLERYLPAVYRAEPEPAAFLERFLANFEGLFTTIEDKIAAVHMLFDVQSTPAEYLDWLAGWLGALLDPAWDERRRRLFLAHAPQIFSQHGTVPGLLRMLRLATEDCPDESIFAASAAGTSMRIVEHFRTRQAPGVVFGDPSDLDGPGLTTAAAAWKPDLGVAWLHQQYRAYLQTRYPHLNDLNAAWGTNYAAFAAIVMPPTRPAAVAQAADWDHFIRSALSFTYASVGPEDTASWRVFLEQRYQYIGGLQKAHQLDPAAVDRFGQVGLPTLLPEEPIPLRDWIQFVSIFLPTLRNAHRFSVLIPTLPRQVQDDRGPFAERVRQVVEREKPAHTLADIKEYWALFRVGEARLGLDSQIDRGSRLTPLVLGSDFLAQSYLSFPHPWSAGDRTVLGRDPIGQASGLGTRV